MAQTRNLKKIVIQSSGTRGDAQPMVAIAMKLQDEGFDVTIFTNKDSLGFVESCGVKAVHVFMDYEHEMTDPSGTQAKALATGKITDLVSALKASNVKWAKTTTKLWWEAITEIKPDLVCSGTLADLFGMVTIRYFKIPTIHVGLQPFPLNPPTMLFGMPGCQCCGVNKFLMNYLVNTNSKGEFETYGMEVKKQFGLDCSKLFTSDDITASRMNPPGVYRSVLGVDPIMAHALYGGASEVPKNIRCVGFWAIDSEKQRNLSKQSDMNKKKSNQFGQDSELQALEAFCKKGEAPIYAGFGSMVARSPEFMVVMLCEAVKLAGCRAVICKGWAKLNQEMLEKTSKDQALIQYCKENVMFVGNTPHEWLFPMCSAIVHHGGAGTTSTAARSLVPQIIIPVWLDQWDFAQFLNTYGSGVGFAKQLLKVNSTEVGEAIKKVRSSPAIKAKAEEWGQLALAQTGTADFVKELLAWWDQEVATGKFEKYTEDALKALNR